MAYYSKTRKIDLSYTAVYSSNGLNTLTTTDRRTPSFGETRHEGYPRANWKQRIKDLKSATTYLDGNRSKIKKLGDGRYNVDLQFLNNGLWIPRRQVLTGLPGITRTISEVGSVAPDFEAADSGASKKFYKKVKALDESFQGLVWLGELRETIRMFKRPLQALRRSARDDYLHKLNRLKRRDPKSWTSGISGSYLEWFYGWRPVMSDIESAFETLQILSQPRIEAHLVHAPYRIEPKPTVTLQSPTVTQTYWYFTYKTTDTTKTKVLYRGLYAREVMRQGNPWTFGNTMSQLGLTFENFIPTAWELLPWSFLIDYFSNVGDILETSFVSLRNVKWINRTRRYTQEKVITASLDYDKTRSSNNNINRRFVGCEELSQAGSMSNRVVFYRDDKYPEVPALQFEVPSSPTKWIAMAALFQQANDIHPQKTRRR